jgi:hypothetical protein
MTIIQAPSGTLDAIRRYGRAAISVMRAGVCALGVCGGCLVIRGDISDGPYDTKGRLPGQI